MIRFQLLTGSRPGETCILRPCDITKRDDGVWIYVPESHKTEHYNKDRVIVIGPKCQRLIEPFLDRGRESFCFSPLEAERRRNLTKRADRKSPMTPSQRRRNSKSHPEPIGVGDCYTRDSYRRAVHRGCDKAFPPPEPLARLGGESERKQLKRLNADQITELKTWQKEHRWSPNRLRHSRATEIRAKFGIEAAQTVLGHSELATTEIYAEKNLKLAVQIMKEVG